MHTGAAVVVSAVMLTGFVALGLSMGSKSAATLDDQRQAQHDQEIAAQSRVNEAAMASQRALAKANAEQAAKEAEQRADLARRDRYTAMKPWERLAAITKVCPATGDTCDEKELSSLSLAAMGTPEAKTIDAAIERAKKAHEAASERAENARSAAEREASRMVACCDGTSSPSCECHRANKRGCCSHHGGVCGCEKLDP